MRLAQGRAGWALLAAGTVGLAVSAAAQVSPAPALLPHAKLEQAADTIDPRDRLAAIKVELAWLTDPCTFPYALAAFVNGPSVEVAGIVPNEAVRQRALQLAGDQAKLPVKDKLLVAPGAAVLPVKNANADLCQTAATTLSKWFNQFPGNFEVKADAAGHITVTGTVPSCEDKLTISRRLGQLTGCTAVLNHLNVVKVTRAGKTFVPVSSDGKQLVAGDPKDLVPQLTPESLPKPLALKKQAPAATAAAAARPAAKPAVASAPASPYGSIAKTSASSVPVTQPAKLAPALANTTTVVQKPSSVPTSPYGGIVQTSATQPASLPAHAGLFSAGTPSTTSAPAVKPVSAPAVRTSAAPVVTGPSKPTPAPTPAKPAAPATAPTPSKPDTTAKKAEPAKGPALLASQDAAQIKQRVEAACGGKARNVGVKVQGAKDVTLSFTVHSEAEGQALGRMVLNLPELVTYKVDLQVDVK